MEKSPSTWRAAPVGRPGEGGREGGGVAQGGRCPPARRSARGLSPRGAADCAKGHRRARPAWAPPLRASVKGCSFSAHVGAGLIVIGPRRAGPQEGTGRRLPLLESCESRSAACLLRGGVASELKDRSPLRPAMPARLRPGHRPPAITASAGGGAVLPPGCGSGILVHPTVFLRIPERSRCFARMRFVLPRAGSGTANLR